MLDAYRTVGVRISSCYAVRKQSRFVYEADEDFCNGLPPEAVKAMASQLAEQKLSFTKFMQLFDELPL